MIEHIANVGVSFEWLAGLWLCGVLMSLWVSSASGISTPGDVSIGGATSLAGSLRIDQNGALVVMNSPGAGANGGLWYIQCLNAGFRIGGANDDLSGQNDIMTFSRSVGSPTVTGTSFGASMRFSNVITDTLVGTPNYAYNPSGLSRAFVLKLSTYAAGSFVMGGILAQLDGMMLCVLADPANTGTILFDQENAIDSAANRFAFQDTTLAAGDSIIIWYDGSVSRWQKLALGLSDGTK